MKHLKYLTITLLVVASFYFTDKIMIYMENQNPLMQEIVEKASNYKTQSVNALVEDNTIIPGIKGKEVNKHKSFVKMDEFGSFNETFIIYDAIKPPVSLDDNLDKIIIKGNSIKRAVSLILENNANVQEYLISEKIKFNLIANTKSDFNIETEFINGESTSEKMSDLNALLNKKKINSKLCLIDYSNIEYCLEKKYYLVAPSLDTFTNITKLISEINSGDIILIRNNTSVDNLKLILSEIKRQDLSVVYLSSLISENN